MPKYPQIPPKPPAGRPPRTVEMVAFEAVQILDVTGPLQVFATATETMINAGWPAPYKVRIVAPDARSVTASAGIALATEHLPKQDAPVDTLIVAGGPGVMQAAADTGLVS